MLRISQIRLVPMENEDENKLNKMLTQKAASLLGLDPSSLRELRIVKRSIDARKKPDVFLCFTVEVRVDHEEKILRRIKNPDITRASCHRYDPILPGRHAGIDNAAPSDRATKISDSNITPSSDGITNISDNNITPSSDGATKISDSNITPSSDGITNISDSNITPSSDGPAKRSPSPDTVKGSLPSPGKKRVLVVGSGPAGLFAAYILALNGLSPILIERGKDVDRRLADVKHFWATGELSNESNVQFGEGGAGTFSDGKLNTGIKDKSGRIDFVARTMAEMGADPSILTDNAPHVGTETLREVVRGLRTELIRLGAQVRFETRLTGIETESGKFKAAILCSTADDTDAGRSASKYTGSSTERLETGRSASKYTGSNTERLDAGRTASKYTGSSTERLEADAIVLALGHSARDSFLMLKELGLPMEYKDFAVGYRVIHPQALINQSQLGPRYASSLGPAPYKLALPGVYSFCMCPGGYVVNSSSEEGRLCVNGMSYSKRDGKYANSAIVMMFTREECINSLTSYAAAGIDPASSLNEKGFTDPDDPLSGLYFQRLLEKRAFDAGRGAIPLQSLGAYKRAFAQRYSADASTDISVDKYGDKRLTSAPLIMDNLVVENSLHISGDVSEAVKGKCSFTDLTGILPHRLETSFLEGMQTFGKRIEGFDGDDVLLAGVESRTSSPVRILRDGSGMSSIEGIYPCGEGAGYAGGIVSAAVDGIKCAENIIRHFMEP